MYSTSAVALLMYLYFAIVPVLAHGRKRTILCCVYKITNKHPQQKRTKRISIMNRSESAKDKTLKRKRKEEKVQRLHQLADFFFHNLILLILHLSFCHFHWILFLLFFSRGNGNAKNVPFWLLYFFLNITLSIDDQLLLIINLKINKVPIFLCIVIHRMVSAAWWMEGVWDIITGLPIIIIIIREAAKKKTRFFLGDLSQIWVGGAADSQTFGDIYQPLFFSIKVPKCGWVGQSKPKTKSKFWVKFIKCIL